MTDFRGEYGLGLYQPYAGTVGHTGQVVGYVAWAGCVPADGTVIVVLSNQVIDDIGGMAGPLVLAAATYSR
jgi:CubicO group peptidase (beta-lactamase class C family)